MVSLTEGRAPISRRAMIRGSLATIAGVALGGCSATAASHGLVPQPRVRPLVVPRISLDRVIRTTAGLRPYRAPGFVVAPQTFDGKVVVHNYGHGGGGISLSWGSSNLAAEIATETEHRRAAVIGAGVMGLTTARLLQDRGFEVTVYARELSPFTTSNMSGGQWNPSSVFSFAEVGDAFLGQFQRASSFAWRYYQSIVGPRYGVRWVDNYVLLNAPPPEGGTSVRSLIPDTYAEWILLGPGEHPFHTPYARRYTTMLVDPATFLDTLNRDIHVRGGRVEQRAFRTLPEVLALDEPLIVNCSGLGARDLFGDTALTPVKGQLAVLVPDERVDYIAQYGSAYMFPRSDGIILGGSFEQGVATLDNDAETIRGIVEANQAIFGG